MKKLALIAVAAGAVVMAGTAQAQIAGRGGHPGGGRPNMPNPGGHMPRPNMPNHPNMPRPNHPGGGNWNHHGGGNWNGGGWNRGGWGNGSSFGGFAFGGYWQQPQYQVQNWQLYGFIAPQQQQRWVRYYDDAYLVDGGGRVYDSRRGVQWDRGGERWERDSYGVPYYVGRGDYYPDRRDYDRADSERRWGGNWDYSGYGSDCGRPQPCGGAGPRGDDRDVVVYRDGRDGRDGYDGRGGYERRDGYYEEGRGGYAGDGRTVTRVYTAPGGGAYGHGGGYSSGYGQSGYGYGGAYGSAYGSGTVIVTETTVTPGQSYVTEEIIEEVVEDRAVRRRHAAPRRAAPPVRHYSPPRRPAPAPRQPSGERG